MFADGLQATDPDDQITQGGQVVGSMPGADGGAIFTKSHVAHVMDGILNAPMASTGTLDLSGAQSRGRPTGQEDLGFLGHVHAFEMMSSAADHGSLGSVGEAGVVRGDFEGIDFPSFMSAVALVQRDVRRGEKSPPGPGKAGRVARRA